MARAERDARASQDDVPEDLPAGSFGFAARAAGASVVAADVGTEPFAARLLASPDATDPGFELEYDEGVASEQDAARLAERMATLLAALAADPARPIDRCEYIGKGERARIDALALGAVRSEQPALLHELVSQQAARTPVAVAVEYDSAQLTYAELERRANQLANHLASMGAGRETLVGVCLQRSLAMPVAVLGVLKSGAGYLAIDPDLPPARVASMLREMRARILLTEEAIADELPADACQMILR